MARVMAGEFHKEVNDKSLFRYNRDFFYASTSDCAVCFIRMFYIRDIGATNPYGCMSARTIRLRGDILVWI